MAQPARTQVSRSELESISNQKRDAQQHDLDGGSAVYNIWHRKWAGSSKKFTQIRSPFRCNINRDSGSTNSESPFFCLWFARGCCYKGSECTYLHRRPDSKDDDILSAINTLDCFGRLKFAELRDDMSGIGSFFHPCRTLFVGYFNDKTPKLELKKLIRSQFSEWGEVSDVRVNKTAQFAFVTFERTCEAEFAKEAMSNQTITGDETLQVKWATPSSTREGSSIEFPEHINEATIREIVRAELNKKPVLEPPVTSSSAPEADQPLQTRISDNEKLQNEPLPKKRRGLVDYD